MFIYVRIVRYGMAVEMNNEDTMEKIEDIVKELELRLGVYDVEIYDTINGKDIKLINDMNIERIEIYIENINLDTKQCIIWLSVTDLEDLYEHEDKNKNVFLRSSLGIVREIGIKGEDVIFYDENGYGYVEMCKATYMKIESNIENLSEDTIQEGLNTLEVIEQCLD